MIVVTDSVKMAIQEWFYLHPWAKILYFILGIPSVYYSLIYCLQRIDRLIVRLPHSLGDSVEPMQGLNKNKRSDFMLNYKQINYIQTMLAKASRKTKQEFEDSGVLLNKETPYTVANTWIKRLEKELGISA